MNLFIQKINQYVRLSDSEKKQIAHRLIYREIPAHHKLVDIGSVCKELIFLEKGCVRLYYLKDGEELSGFLFTENMMLSSLESFLSGQASVQILESVEPCTCWVLSKKDLDDLLEQIPKLNIFFRKILEERFIVAQRVVASFVLDKPEERYLNLLSTQPELFQRFPQHMLASLLGITPVSLSRIRKRIASKNA